MEEQKTHQDNPTDTINDATHQTVVTEQPTPVTTTSDPVSAKSGMNGKIILAFILGIILVGGLYYFFQRDSADLLLNSPEAGQDGDLETYPEVVATVNGEELSNEAFVRSLNQVKQMAAEQGADLTDASITTQIETQAIDTLVNTTLLSQAAEESGLEISDEVVTAEIEKINSQFESEAALAQAMAELGLDEEGLRNDIHRQLLIDEYLTTNTEIDSATVTAEEVQQLYDTVSAQQTGLPPLEALYESIEEQLVAQKQQQLISEFIQGLRAEAEIEILL